ncbi:alpha/beta hydrolase [Heyndrickxia sp. NPDC080065]|uniref:alpha/beta hydrolase n=1 Tax=Heyndrickxia sp. NPDC080065 TaxID=3390568 RepID=UPI003CFC116B
MIEHFEVVITPFDRKRTVRVHLPTNYHADSDKIYPVLYMHDGQNLFKDEDASYGISWGISEYLQESRIELIVVGIDCSSEGYKRLDEYSPWKSSAMSEIFSTEDKEIGGEGKEYIDFIVHTLKPMIDHKYRTNPDDTSMAGSSMGGLISTYAACAYPSIFRKIAAVSSAFWFNQNEIEDFIKNSDLSSIEKFYLDIGTKESTGSIDSQKYVESSKSVYRILKNKVKNSKFVIAEDAIHNEKAWKKRVPSILSYLLGHRAGSIVPGQDKL